MNDQTNQAAFPHGHDPVFAQHGLTKREYFASAAMQAYISATNSSDHEGMATDAVKNADAPIAALEKE